MSRIFFSLDFCKHNSAPAFASRSIDYRIEMRPRPACRQNWTVRLDRRLASGANSASMSAGSIAFWYLIEKAISSKTGRSGTSCYDGPMRFISARTIRRSTSGSLTITVMRYSNSATTGKSIAALGLCFFFIAGIGGIINVKTWHLVKTDHTFYGI